MGDIQLVSGPQLFLGYGLGATFNRRDPFFPTGDRGNADADQWITLTGRAKEVINRGGELMSPFEIEEACTHGAAPTVMAFSAPHKELGEIVAIAVPHDTRATLEDIHMVAMKRLALPALPQVMVIVPQLPRTNGTGKLQRVGYAEKLKMAPMEGMERRTFRLDDHGNLRAA